MELGSSGMYVMAALVFAVAAVPPLGVMLLFVQSYFLLFCFLDCYCCCFFCAWLCFLVAVSFCAFGYLLPNLGPLVISNLTKHVLCFVEFLIYYSFAAKKIFFAKMITF
jgi:hypothetical protein